MRAEFEMSAQTLKGYMEQHALELAEQVWPTRPIVVRLTVEHGPCAWFVLQTVSRGEKKAIAGLTESGFQSYWPTYLKDMVHHRSHKWIRKRLPLFNRYLFAELPVNPKHWAPVYSIEEIDCALGSNGMPCPVKPEVVEKIMSDQREGRFDDTGTAQQKTLRRFPLGSRIRAKIGPFGGFAGLVTNVRARGSLEALIDIFGRLTPVEFQTEAIELI